MVSEGRGRLLKRKDGKYWVYLPVNLAEDSMFPFKNWQKTERGADSIPLKVRFDVSGKVKALIVEEWSEDLEKEES